MVRIDSENLHHTIALVDGLPDSAPQLLAMEGMFTIQAARAAYAKTQDSNFNGRLGAGIIIYGVGGWHRYYVNSCGFIRFSSRHASSKEALRRAQEAGFEIQ